MKFYVVKKNLLESMFSLSLSLFFTYASTCLALKILCVRVHEVARVAYRIEAISVPRLIKDREKKSGKGIN